jgi:hypothetical protein
MKLQSQFEKKSILYLKIYLNIGTHEAIECHRRELAFKFLSNLHGGQMNDEDSYITKMSMSACDGGLWGDFTTIFWLSQYLQHPIYIWNKTNAQIMMKVGNDYETQILNIIYDNSHFELVEYCFQIMNNANANIQTNFYIIIMWKMN